MKRKPTAIAADALTLTRGILISITLIILAIFRVRSYEVVLALVFIGWMTDWHDGRLARKSNQQSWVGRDEVTMDLVMGMSAAIYILSVFDLPLFVFAYLIFWLALSMLAIYGRIRHKAMSFIWFIESGFWGKGWRFVPIGVPFLTLCMIAYAIFFGNLNTLVMSSVFLFLGAFHLPIGFRSKKREAEGVAPLKDDLHRATRLK